MEDNNYVKRLQISSAVTFVLYFFKLLFGGLGYRTIFDFYGVEQGEIVAKSLVEPIMFLVLMGFFWIGVTRDQRAFYVVFIGFILLLILQMITTFGSFDSLVPITELDSSKNYCKALELTVDGIEDDLRSCRTAIAMGFFNIVALAVDLYFTTKIVLSFSPILEYLQQGEPYNPQKPATVTEGAAQSV